MGSFTYFSAEYCAPPKKPCLSGTVDTTEPLLAALLASEHASSSSSFEFPFSVAILLDAEHCVGTRLVTPERNKDDK